MKKISLLLSLLSFLQFFSQKISYIPTIKVSYDASLQLGEKNRHNQKFVLIANSQDYYFAADQKLFE